MFRRAGVEVAVIEVGLGGRFDATNVITPAAAAITTIGMDHQQHLGSTIAAIAREKAGIIKNGVPVVVGELPPTRSLSSTRWPTSAAPTLSKRTRSSTRTCRWKTGGRA
jgi:folylpolyglutamate synthase/dihydropteroate synthase